MISSSSRSPHKNYKQFLGGSPAGKDFFFARGKDFYLLDWSGDPGEG